MALDKIAGTNIGKFGSLTSAAKSKADKSIFGNDACHTVCSYNNAFDSFVDSFNCSTKDGKANIEREIAIMTGQDKKPDKPVPKKLEMNMKSFMALQKELGLGQESKFVTLCS